MKRTRRVFGNLERTLVEIEKDGDYERARNGGTVMETNATTYFKMVD